jgi:AAA family ATP:ADP antiporter
VDGRERRAQHAQGGHDEPPHVEGSLIGFLFRDKYLVLLAALTFLLNCVNTNGEYILDRTLLAAVESGAAGTQDPSAFIGAFKGEYFGWVNLIGVLLQLFVVSRVLRIVGVRRALYVLPLVAFASYSVILAAPLLALIRIGKIAENSLDYSVQNTARQALFLVGTRAEKYVGKTIVDTIMVRLGDVTSAGLVFLATQIDLPTKAFAALNLGLIGCWLAVITVLGREHLRRSNQIEAGAQPGPSP